MLQGSKCAVSRIPEEFNIHRGKSTNLLTFPLGKVSNSVNFPILLWEIEIKCLFPLVVIKTTTENLTSFRNLVSTRRGHLDYDERL